MRITDDQPEDGLGVGSRRSYLPARPGEALTRFQAWLDTPSTRYHVDGYVFDGRYERINPPSQGSSHRTPAVAPH